MFTPDVPPVDPSVALKQVAWVTVGFVALFALINVVSPEAPMVRRQYPYGETFVLLRHLAGLIYRPRRFGEGAWQFGHQQGQSTLSS